MGEQKNSSQLTSLEVWSHNHIERVFESSTDEESLRAVDETFADHVTVEVNGRPAGKNDIKRSVSMLRRESPSGLKVEWKQSVEAPEDPGHRSGTFGGTYVIKGIQREVPGHVQVLEFERHKSIIVRIESQYDNDTTDSRKITKLTFVAVDIRVVEA